MLKKLPISLTIVFVALGVLLTTQFQSQQLAVKSLAGQTPEDLAVLVKNLTDKKYDLISEKMDLQSQLKIFENGADDEDLEASMAKELTKLKILNGQLEAKGSGIKITILKPSADYPLAVEELVAIINDLWHLKAEAVAVNEIRIVGSTKLSESYNDNYAITINGQKVHYPIKIEAIGDPEKLKTGINVGGGVIFQLQTPPYNFKIDVTESQELTLPKSKSVKFSHAKQTDTNKTK